MIYGRSCVDATGAMGSWEQRVPCVIHLPGAGAPRHPATDYRSGRARHDYAGLL